MQWIEDPKPSGKTVNVSARQRLALRRLLAGEQKKCSATALTALQRRGWVQGPGTGYQLTEAGWRIAELSERLPPDRGMELQLS